MVKKKNILLKQNKKEEAYLDMKSQREELENNLKQLDSTIVKSMDSKEILENKFKN